MLLKRKLFWAITILLLNSSCLAVYDVSDVLFQGDCTIFGMKIEGAYFSEGAFLIVTTGARYEYATNKLKIYQGLGSNINDKRLVATFTFKNVGVFEKVEANDDHVLLWSEKLNIGVYGDSTLILTPKVKLEISCKGNFEPDYEGRHKGELLLIDTLGGIEIYPQRYKGGYDVINIDLGKKEWIVDYLFNANERIMVAAFPCREFDWDKSFSSHVAVTCGSVGFGKENPFGQMPSDEAVRKWSENFDIIAMFPFGLYKNYKPGSPYVVGNESELRRLIKTAHEYKMKVVLYCSIFYYARRHKGLDGFYEDIKSLRDKFGIDGVYIDGPTFDVSGTKIDDKIANWQTMRKLRTLFGNDGVIVFHDTQNGNPVSTAPNIDAYCDVTLNGEGISYNSFEDPYIQYHVRKYGISNTIAIWKMGSHPKTISYKDAIDWLIQVNGRGYWGFFVPPKAPPKDNNYIWPTEISPNLRYYFNRLREEERKYKKKQSTRANEK